MKTLLEILRSATTWLHSKGVPTPRLDAEILLGHVLHLDRTSLYLNFERPLSEVELEAFRVLLRRRGAREPVAYLTGTKGFHAIDLSVVPGVLIPRPDTETLVEAALAKIDLLTRDPVYVADVGGGSGAVGLAIAHARPQTRVYITDISPIAIDTLKTNTQALGLTDRVANLSGPLLSPIPADRPIDWVVSNPPYIPTAVIDGLEPEVSVFEPRLALDGGEDGLAVITPLLHAAFARAREGILLEIGYDQSERVQALARDAGFTDIEVYFDPAGHPRVIGGHRPAR